MAICALTCDPNAPAPTPPSPGAMETATQLAKMIFADGRHYPAMALVQVVALVEDRAKVEIEATAVIPEA